MAAADLLRYTPSGTYFAKVRVGGKLFRESLKLKVFSVAKLRLAGLIKEKRAKFGIESRVDAGKMSFGDVLEVYRQCLDNEPDQKEGAKTYRRQCIAALLKSWPDLQKTSVGEDLKGCLSGLGAIVFRLWFRQWGGGP